MKSAVQQGQAHKRTRRQAKYTMNDIPVEIRKDFVDDVLPKAKVFAASLNAFERPSTEELEDLMNSALPEYQFDFEEEGSPYAYLVCPFARARRHALRFGKHS